jgi:hypothetical protein
MIVRCLSFGTYWWLREGAHPVTGVPVLARSAYMNTTSIYRGKTATWGHWVPGFLRVNATMNPRFLTPNDLIGELIGGLFYTNGIEKYKESNRLLLKKRAKDSTVPDVFLVRITSEKEGKIDFESDWRRGAVRIFSSSFHDGSQETLLLIGKGGIVTTELGEWEVACSSIATILALK